MAGSRGNLPLSLHRCRSPRRFAPRDDVFFNPSLRGVAVAISRSLCHPECNEGSPRLLHAINAGCLLSASRRFFTSFRMTAYGVQNDKCRSATNRRGVGVQVTFCCTQTFETRGEQRTPSEYPHKWGLRFWWGRCTFAA